MTDKQKEAIIAVNKYVDSDRLPEVMKHRNISAQRAHDGVCLYIGVEFLVHISGPRVDVDYVLRSAVPTKYIGGFEMVLDRPISKITIKGTLNYDD